MFQSISCILKSVTFLANFCKIPSHLQKCKMSIFDSLSVHCVPHSSLCINIIQNDNTDHYKHNYYKTKTGNGKFGQKGAF